MVLVDGLWEMDDGTMEDGIGGGQGSMRDGQWAIGNGRWVMGDGTWEIRHGRWEMGDGIWEIGDGQLKMGDERWLRWAMGRWPIVRRSTIENCLPSVSIHYPRSVDRPPLVAHPLLMVDCAL